MDYCLLYRSTVGLCFTGTAWKELQSTMDTLQIENYILYSDVKDLIVSGNAREDTISKSVVLYWENIQWTEDNSAVLYLQEFLSTISDNDYLLLRIGGAYDDLEVWGRFWENPFGMQFMRKVIVAIPHDAPKHTAAAHH